MLDRRTLLKTGAGLAALPIVGCASARPSPELLANDFSDLNGLCDGAVPLDTSDWARHIAKIQRSMAEAELTAVVVEPGPTMFYLSGVRWRPSERAFLLVVPSQGAPWWVCPAFEAERARERAGATADLRLWQEHEDPSVLVAKGLSKTSAAKVAVAPGMRHFIFSSLQRALAPRTVVSGRTIVENARISKDRAELALLDQANRATKAALAAVATKTHIGMKESVLRRMIHAAQAAAGLTNTWALVLFGPNAAFPHGTGRERALADGDLVLVDTGGQLHGYCSDITRTWAVGPVSDETRRIYDVVLQAQGAAFERLGPGVPCEQVDAAARSVIDKAGFGADYEAFTHRLGHGIGLQGHEHPYLVRGNQRILQPGMTMSNEPGIYIPGKVGVRIEDIVAITEDGYRVFGPTVSSFESPV